MQTFLPYPDFEHSAACLDRQRLGKQRVEVLQILRTLNGETNGWRNHPAVLMWDGYTEALVEYGICVCCDWMRRGYNYSPKVMDQIISYSWGNEVVIPPWLNKRFCRSHQSNLVRKYPEHYRKYFPNVPDDLPYVWPTKEGSYVSPATATARDLPNYGS